MLASITPLGERARRARWARTTAVYIAGSVLGGAAVGALAGIFGSLVLGGVGLRPRLALVAAALLVGLVWEASRGTVPGPRRQVNERWLERYRSWVYGLGFGAQLGAGITTVVVTSTVYVVVVVAFESAELGAAVGAIAGGLRGATILAGARISTPERLASFHRRMRTMHRPVRTTALATQLGLLGLAVVGAVG